MAAIDHYFRALELSRVGGPVSLEEARELLAANDDPHDPVCPTQEHRSRIITTLIDTTEALKHALPYCYEPCDQTVQCPECGATWWDQDEDIDQNWHAEGCKLFAANVLVGLSKNEKDKDNPNTAGPNPDTRTPSQILRDQVLNSWFQKIAHMGYGEEPPQGMDKGTWQRVIIEVMDRLRREVK
jgi:hypothetical protein